MKQLLKGSGCGALITGGTELHIVIDVSHDPWKKLAECQIELLIRHLQELGLGTEQFETMLSAILNTNGTLQ